VYVYGSGGSFTMTGDAIIEGNTAASGGGVYIGSQCNFTMSEDAIIQGNTATSTTSGGGGVYVTGSGSTTFTKTGDAVIYGDTNNSHAAGDTENTAATGNGHAVYLSGGGKKRNTNASEDVDLYAWYSGGTWSYEDSSAGGAGDTTANWE
jgi:hypothetical protein